MSAVLSAFECSGIQPFIFGSDRLRENVGASQIVADALEVHLGEAILKLRPGAAVEWRDATTWLADASVPEVLYIGGGNALAYFPNADLARDVARVWSERLLEVAPGLVPQCAHVRYTPPLTTVIDAAMAALAENKGSPLLSVGAECLPLTRRCGSTGLAASAWHKFPEEAEARWISRASLVKREAAIAARARLEEALFGAEQTDVPRLPNETDELVVEGQPHVAVIHIDGNGVGELFRTVHGQAASDADAAQKLRHLSATIADHSARCMNGAGQWILSRREQVPTSRDVAPVRPLVSGGDDLTVITNGTIGLQFAAAYLSEWSTGTAPDGTPLSACAGVALVQSHFPFERAYEFAAELCGRAKGAARGVPGSSWIDFEVLPSGATGDLAQLGEQRRAAWRTLGDWRPWRVCPDDPDDEHAWNRFVEMIGTFRQWPQSAAKELRDAYELGTVGSVLSQLKARPTSLPRIDATYAHVDGYYSGKSAFLDGLDAMDFFAADAVVSTGAGT